MTPLRRPIRTCGSRSHGRRGIITACGSWLLATLSATPAVAEPLAACKLQSFVEQQSDYMIAGANFLLPQGDLDDSLSYRRSPSGDWLVPKEVKAEDPAIRGLLLTPSGPVRIDLLVTIAGKPYQAVREGWIDLALNPPAEEPEAASAEVPDEQVDNQASDSAEQSPGEEEPAAPEAMRPAGFMGATPRDWLADYVKNSGAPIDRYEARWLLAQRAGGPALMELERFSTNRSSAAPLVSFLDTDADGSLSKQEIEEATARLSACDYNQDGSVDLTEMNRNRPNAPSAFQVWRAEPLFVVLSDYTDLTAIESVASQYYEEAKQDSDVVNIEQLAGAPAEVVVVVRYEEESEQPQVELSKSTVGTGIRTSADAIVVELGAVDLELGAGRPRGASKTSQVSVGAVVEGAPLWDLIDSNHDGSLSYRERSNTTDRLKELDTDQDEQLTRAEIPTRLRLGVALGPNVHRLLERARPIVPKQAEEAAPDAPGWFMSMDANGDGDLTSNEFLGTAEQFSQYDANSDGLITVVEAAAPGE